MKDFVKCDRCKGSGSLSAELENLGTKRWDRHIIGCPNCYGRGWRGDETGRVYGGMILRNERPYGSERERP